MAKTKQDLAEWPVLQAWWAGDQLMLRSQRGETTVKYLAVRLLDWMGKVIQTAHLEYSRREALAQEVADLKQQLAVVQVRLAQLESGAEEEA